MRRLYSLLQVTDCLPYHASQHDDTGVVLPQILELMNRNWPLTVHDLVVAGDALRFLAAAGTCLADEIDAVRADGVAVALPLQVDLVVKISPADEDEMGIVEKRSGLKVGISGEYGEKSYCIYYRWAEEDNGSLRLISMPVSPLVKGDLLLECFYEYISQSLGLWRDLALTPESMYRSHDENKLWPRPTWHDVIMLRTLYDPRIKPGMPEDQAMPIVCVIIAELLE
jgi:hypothetical protein